MSRKRWTQEQINALGSLHDLRKEGRYGANKRCVHPDGTKFDSGSEMARYCDLLLLQKAGVIAELEVHPVYPITIGGVEVRMFSKRYFINGRHLSYEADFRYFDVECGRKIIEDVKMGSGHRTEVYKIKKALMTAMGLEITEV